MSCYASYSYDLHDQDEKMKELLAQQLGISFDISFSSGWTYWVGWASSGVALVGAIISSNGLCILPDIAGESGNSFMRLK